MAVTVQQIFDMALVMIDEVEDSGKLTDENIAYYKTKVLSIISSLQSELLPHSIIPPILTDMSQPLLIPDRLAISAMPYGVAAHLLLHESDASHIASFYHDRYEELKKKTMAEYVPIRIKGGLI